jgi:hypothetical protein
VRPAGLQSLLRSVPRSAALAALAGAIALADAVALSGCGGDQPAPRAGPARLSEQRLQQANCTDWRRASLRDRYLVVDRLEEVVRGPRGEGRTLPDDRAYEIIDGRCENYFARGFLLYEIYTRAAAFDRIAGD